jgi:hypothetical protein
MAEGLVGITCRPLNAHPLDCGQHDHLKIEVVWFFWTAPIVNL